MGNLARYLVFMPALLCSGVPALGQGVFKDEALGFELRLPRGWKQIPIRPDESYLVGKYQAEDAERALDPKTGVQFTHTPEVLIVAFLDSDVEGVPEQKTRLGTTYKDFQDFMRANYSQGFFVEKEETSEHKGLPVTELSIKVEAGVGVLEKTITAWVYETEIGRIAVSYEVVQESFQEHRGSIDKLMKSFKVIPRTKEIKLGVTESGFLSTADMEKMTPAERRDHKLQAQRAEWQNMAAALPGGWEAVELDGVFVLTHVDKKYTQEVVDHVNNIMKWLNDTFPDIGPLEYARSPLVRICEDQKEETAFREGSGTSSVWGTHLVTHQSDRDSSFEWEYIGSRTLQIWLLERDSELSAALPEWLRQGLGEVVRSATSKGSKLRFGDSWWKQYMRDKLPGADEMIDLERFFSMTRDDFVAYAEREDLTASYQAGMLARFFVDSGSKKQKAILVDYMGNLRKALDEYEAKDAEQDKDRKRPQNEEEEDAYLKERAERIKQRERELLDRTAELTFGEWDKGDWLELQRAFGRTL